MAHVGGVACDYVKMGSIGPISTRIERWQIDGGDGYGSLKLGKANAAFVFTAVKFDTVVNVNTWANNMAAKAGDVITIVDDDGTAYLNMQFDFPTFSRSPAREPGTSIALRGQIILRGVQVKYVP